MEDINFGNIKHTNEFDVGFWYARELGLMLGYVTFDKFRNVIAKAVVACKNSGVEESYHFSHLGKMIEIGKGAMREREDYLLERKRYYTLYLLYFNR